MKRRIKKVYKKLPPHTYEAHPVANAGQASKPFIIAVITIVAVVALTLLLLFSDQLVGKAFFTGQANSAGAELTAPAYENQPFSLKIKANTAAEVNTLGFTLNLPKGMTCAGLLLSNGEVQNLLGWDLKADNMCNLSTNQVVFGYATTGAGKSGTFDVAQIGFAGMPVGTYEYIFESFTAYDTQNPPNDVIKTFLHPTVEVVLAPFCGDGEINLPSEQCDDGNNNNNDGCSAQCLLEAPAVCGNAAVESTEKCDDGSNNGNPNYCNSDCTGITTPVCGNAVKEGTEQCEDGNTVDGDGCSSTCTLEQQQVQGYCGDSVVDAALGELCDDGNTETHDGCSSTCKPEEGWSCTGQPSACVQIQVQQFACGNTPSGIVSWWKAENNADDIIGNNQGTLINPSSNYLPGKVGQAFSLGAIQYVNVPNNANLNSNQFTLSAWFKLNANREWNNPSYILKKDGNYLMELYPGTFALWLYDGFQNDAINTGDFAPVAGEWTNYVVTYDGSIASIYVDGILRKSGALAYNPLNTESLRIGDGFDGLIDEVAIWNRALTISEIQNIFNADSAGMCIPVCGNAVKEGTEQCDDGNTGDGDGCTNCVTDYCGDGDINYDIQLNAMDECDDDNNVNGDGCSAICEVESGWSCDGNNPTSCQVEQCIYQQTSAEGCSQLGECAGSRKTCTQDNVWGACNKLPSAEICDQKDNDCDGQTDEGNVCQLQQQVCGNRLKEGTEQCDDGNTVNGDGCSSTCTVEQQQVQGYCGDGAVNSNLGELCDDGNIITRDGCSSTCNLEEGWLCTGQPSACTQAVQTQIQQLTVQGTKITLTDVDTLSAFATKVTATEGFSGTEIIIYTVLYGSNNKVLSIKSEKVEAGLTQRQEYTATVNYPLTNVKSKSVIVYDVEQNPSVFGQLQKSYE